MKELRRLNCWQIHRDYSDNIVHFWVKSLDDYIGTFRAGLQQLMREHYVPSLIQTHTASVLFSLQHVTTLSCCTMLISIFSDPGPQSARIWSQVLWWPILQLNCHMIHWGPKRLSHYIINKSICKIVEIIFFFFAKQPRQNDPSKCHNLSHYLKIKELPFFSCSVPAFAPIPSLAALLQLKSDLHLWHS